MDARVTAVLYRFAAFFLIGFVLALVPALQSIVAAGQSQFSWNGILWSFFAALVAGLVGAAEKVLAPLLFTTLNSSGQVVGVKGVPLRALPPSSHFGTHIIISNPAPEPAPATDPAEPTADPTTVPIDSSDPAPPVVPNGPVPPLSGAVAALEQQLTMALAEKQDLQARLNTIQRGLQGIRR